MMLIGRCATQGLEQLDDGCCRTYIVGHRAGIHIQSCEAVHGVDDVVDIGGGDEAGAGRNHASGKCFLVVGVLLVGTHVGVAGGNHEGGGEVRRIA